MTGNAVGEALDDCCVAAADDVGATGTTVDEPQTGALAAATGSTAGQPISPELVAAATRVLTQHMGPIASVVVKKAAGKASSREQLFALLSEQVGDGVERAQLVKQLSQLP